MVTRRNPTRSAAPQKSPGVRRRPDVDSAQMALFGESSFDERGAPPPEGLEGPGSSSPDASPASVTEPVRDARSKRRADDAATAGPRTPASPSGATGARTSGPPCVQPAATLSTTPESPASSAAGDDATATPTDIAALADAMRTRVARWSRALEGNADDARAAADAAARLVAAQHEGHVCIRIDTHDERQRLEASKVVALADTRGATDADLPFVLDTTGRLYLQRVFDHERALAQRVVQACRLALSPPTGDVQQRLADLFARPSPARRADTDADTEPDRQALAAALALSSPLLVISGGPGTGKTTTLARILDLVRRQSRETRIGLAAPTGKAAARMTQALRAARDADPSLDLPPLHAHTVHAWLRVHPRTGRAAHDARHPLGMDLLVVDEASMLDLELARALFDALPPRARVVLLGDQDQLAAVQAGAVFAELASIGDASTDPARAPTRSASAAHAAAPAASLAQGAARRVPSTSVDATPPGADAKRDRPAVVHLLRGYRFDADSGIAQLAQALRDGDADAAVALLRASAHRAELAWLATPSVSVTAGAPGATAGTPAWTQHLASSLEPYLHALRALDAGNVDIDADDDPVRTCLRALDRWRALCAVHDGASGTRQWNARAVALVRQAVARQAAGSTSASGANRAFVSRGGDAGPWFTGRAVMVTRNEPALGLVNGDVGIVLPLPVGPGRRGAHRDIGSGGDGGHDPGLRRAAFLRADGSLVRWPVARLPAVETAFATSVHKAQGSEFDRVTLVLPSPWQRPCTRELVYTAVTRARRHVTVVADEASLRASIAMRTERLGGLRVRLDEARLR